MTSSRKYPYSSSGLADGNSRRRVRFQSDRFKGKYMYTYNAKLVGYGKVQIRNPGNWQNRKFVFTLFQCQA